MTPITPPFANVLNVYMRHVVHELHPEPDVHEGLEKVICLYIVNLQRENKSESKIYELVAKMKPDLGDPLAFHEEFVIKYDESYKNAAKAQKKVAKEAATSSLQALMELTNKQKCHKIEQAKCNKHSQTSALTTPSIHLQANQALPGITPWKNVAQNVVVWRQWFHHHTGVNGDGILCTFTVKYDKSGSTGGRSKVGIPYSCLSEIYLINCNVTGSDEEKNKTTQ